MTTPEQPHGLEPTIQANFGAQLEKLPPGVWNPGSLHAHFTARLRDHEHLVESLMRDLQGQIDRRLETQIRERQDTERHLGQRIDDLVKQVESSDQALRVHIEQQVAQVRDALDSARREADIRFQAAQEAIHKSEVATERRFESINEWRSQLADRERAHQEQLAAVLRDLLRREVFDAAVAEWSRWRAGVDKRLTEMAGVEAGQQQAKERGRRQTGTIIAALAAAATVLSVVIVLANTLTG